MFAFREKTRPARAFWHTSFLHFPCFTLDTTADVVSVLPYRVAQNQEYGDGTGKQSIAEQVLCRQSTVEFIGSLLKAVDMPDEPLPHLFETLPSTAQGLASLSDTTGSNVSRSCSPSLSIGLKLSLAVSLC